MNTSKEQLLNWWSERITFLFVIPRGLPREFHLLEQTTRRRIGEEIEKLAETHE